MALFKCAYCHLEMEGPTYSELASLRTELAAVKAERDRLRKALTDISVYGCGMLNQPIAMNGPEEAWLRRRIAEYESRAARALLPEGRE